MPKISKVRIVNLNYNDGNRLIADELYDFSSQRNDDALNVLINLANGGGKSVLVQMMMQPIIPKAKVAGRKIESFFRKISDHCFVAIEWLKDNSKEKLLTGIAIAAKEMLPSDDETSGNMGIKYYTFYANYASDASECSLVNLPLSRRENSKFIPADYDEIKKFAKKCRTALTCYSSDDNPHWQRKLEEYGIVQDEWRMIEKLNSEEGGLGKFFGEFKNSDQLVDKLLIPTIESKSKLRSSSKENSSLATMLVSYVHQYADRKNRLLEKEGYEKFRDNLELLKPIADELWTSDDKLHHAENTLFGLSAALNRKTAELQTKQQETKDSIYRLNEKAHHIKWEKASSDYYKCKDAFEAAKCSLDEANENDALINSRYKETAHNITVLECSNYYSQLLDAKSSKNTIRDLIQNQKNNSDAAEQIDNLRYSAACAIKNELSSAEPKLREYGQQKEKLSRDAKAQKEEIGKLNISSAKLKSSVDSLSGRLEGMEEETDKLVDSLNAELYRRIDRSYSQEEIERIKAKNLSQSDMQKELKQKAENTIEDIERRIDEIPDCITKLESEISHIEKSEDDAKNELKNYDMLEDEIESICKEYNLNFSKRFTSHIKDYLNSELSVDEAKYAENLRQIDLAQEEISAARQGHLHIPKAVIDYLNSTGIPYNTCENYLLSLEADGTLTKEECQEILLNCPAAAYGIIMDRSRIESFFKLEKEKWLPALVPIFTNEELESILKKEIQFSDSIAFYSAEYFSGKDNYISNLTDYLAQLQEKKKSIEYRRKRINDQLNILSSFTYKENWRDEQEIKIENFEKEIQKHRSEEIELKNEKTSLQARKAGSKAEIQKCTTAIMEISAKLDTIDKISRRLKDEALLAAQISEKRSELEKENALLKKAEELINSLQNDLSAAEENFIDCKKLVDELNAALSEVDGIPSSKIIEGSWRELYVGYKKSVEAADEEIRNLQLKLENYSEKVSFFEEEIQNRALPEEDYIHVTYSEERLNNLKRQKEQLDASCADSREEVSRAVAKHAKNEAWLENAENALKTYGNPLPES